MKDVLAFLLIFIIVLLAITVFSEEPPEGKFEKTVCANVTCYYEIKDEK